MFTLINEKNERNWDVFEYEKTSECGKYDFSGTIKLHNEINKIEFSLTECVRSTGKTYVASIADHDDFGDILTQHRATLKDRTKLLDTFTNDEGLKR